MCHTGCFGRLIYSLRGGKKPGGKKMVRRQPVWLPNPTEGSSGSAFFSPPFPFQQQQMAY
jgi:hypothetical protein